MKKLDLDNVLKNYSLIENTKISKKIEEKLKYYHFGLNQNVKITTFGVYDFLEKFFRSNNFISSHYLNNNIKHLIAEFPIDFDLYRLIENDKFQEPSNSVDYFLLSVDFELAYSKKSLVEEIWRVLKINSYLFILDLNKFHFTNYIKGSPFKDIAKKKKLLKLNWFKKQGFELEIKDQINIGQKINRNLILKKLTFFYYPYINLFIFKKKTKPALKNLFKTNLRRGHLLETQ